MIQFLYHDAIKKEIAALERRFRNIREGLKVFERLCEFQFHPTNPRPGIGPGKLHRITQNEIWTMWKVELVIPKSSLRPNQYPRMWFATKGSIIAFLCISTHIDNYEDNTIEKIGLSRVTDIF